LPTTTTTERLRLEPVRPEHAGDLWTLHQDPVVAQWFAGTWSPAEADHNADSMAAAWDRDGVSKWMAYEHATGALVGRGGLSRMTADAAVTDAIVAVLGDDGWRADRLELGWSLLSAHQGKGYATEIGRAGLGFGFRPTRCRQHRRLHRAAQRRVPCRDGAARDAVRRRVHRAGPGRGPHRCARRSAVRAVRRGARLIRPCGDSAARRTVLRLPLVPRWRAVNAGLDHE